MKKLYAAFFAALLFSSYVKAQISAKGSVIDASGVLSSGGLFTNISASGQPGGISEASGGAYVNQAGFLGAVSLKPTLDTDTDGLADEVDQDNDNDRLADTAEISGTNFNPATATLVNLADTDGDGVIDGFEAAAGTNPQDANSMLELIAISNAAGNLDVRWLARGNNEKKYVVYARPQLGSSSGTVVFSNTLSGGSAPWYAVTGSVAQAATSNYIFYAVEVLP